MKFEPAITDNYITIAGENFRVIGYYGDEPAIVDPTREMTPAPASVVTANYS